MVQNIFKKCPLLFEREITQLLSISKYLSRKFYNYMALEATECHYVKKCTRFMILNTNLLGYIFNKREFFDFA